MEQKKNAITIYFLIERNHKEAFMKFGHVVCTKLSLSAFFNFPLRQANTMLIKIQKQVYIPFAFLPFIILYYYLTIYLQIPHYNMLLD